MIKSVYNKNVFWSPAGTQTEMDGPLAGGWYFWDEAGLIGGGPYLSEQMAIDALSRYARDVLVIKPKRKKRMLANGKTFTN
jgi:hypothetical protein